MTASAPTARSARRRHSVRFAQLVGLSGASAVLMIAGCAGRVSDQDAVDLATLGTASTSSTAVDLETAAASVAVAGGGIVSEPQPEKATIDTSEGPGPTTGSQPSLEEPDAWTTTTAALDHADSDGHDDPEDQAPAAPVTTPAPTSTTSASPAAAVTPPPKEVRSDWSGPATVAKVVVPSIGVFRSPATHPGPSGADWTFDSVTQFGSPTTFLVTGSQGDWLQVLLPVRQKHTTGWVHNTQVNLTSHRYHATVSVSSRQVVVYNDGVMVRNTGVVVGKSSTPTPLGRFYVTDKLRHANPGGAYGPWILALSARSETLTSFNGGEPIVALHGTNKPWLIGGAHSNGCIRMPNEVITALAEVVPLGTPVDIIA